MHGPEDRGDGGIRLHLCLTGNCVFVLTVYDWRRFYSRVETCVYFFFLDAVQRLAPSESCRT